jgi:hypothetical protein
MSNIFQITVSLLMSVRDLLLVYDYTDAAVSLLMKSYIHISDYGVTADVGAGPVAGVRILGRRRVPSHEASSYFRLRCHC